MKDFYSATVINNKRGIYINPVDNTAYINPKDCINYQSVNFEGVNHIVVYRENDGTMWICQAGGFTNDRGMFTDCYYKSGEMYRLI